MVAIDAKAAMRTAAKAARGAIDPSQRARGAERVADYICELLISLAPATVAGYASIGSELDPSPTMSRLATIGWRLALPVMVGRDVPLVFRAWAQGDPLDTREWGIREPQSSAAQVQPEVLLVPLLAFDATGRRLGYGGGYYDRTIAALRQSHGVLTIGVAFAEQRVDAVPTLAYDQPLDHIVTPEGVISLPGPA